MGRRYGNDDPNHKFYTSRAWRRLRKQILAEDHYECVICKSRGRYSHATHVHHVMHYDKHPELGMERYYTDADGNRQRNLISVCFACHKEIHGYGTKAKAKPLTDERW